MKYDEICCSGYQLARMLGRTQKRMRKGHCGGICRAALRVVCDSCEGLWQSCKLGAEERSERGGHGIC